MAQKEDNSDSAMAEYLPQLQAEYDSLDTSFTHARKLMESEIQKVKSGGSSDEAKKFIEVHNMTPVKVSINIILPTKEHPKFNFVGKLLGPGGSSLKQLQQETQTRMAIQGRGSMRDKRKEEEFRQGGDPKYSHLSEDLHLRIHAYAPASEAYSRIANALRAVQPFLIPEMNDHISNEQMTQLRGGRGDMAVEPAGRGGRRGAMMEPTARGAMPPRRGDDYGYGREPPVAAPRASAYDDYGTAELRSARDPYAAPGRAAYRDPYDAPEPRVAASRDPYGDGYGQPAAADPVRDRYAEYDAPPARSSWGASAGNGYQTGGGAGGYGKVPSARGGRVGGERSHPYGRGGGRSAAY